MLAMPASWQPTTHGNASKLAANNTWPSQLAGGQALTT